MVSWIIRITGLLLSGLFIYLTVHYFSLETVTRVSMELIYSPLWLGVMMSTYALSFCVKAYVWQTYIGETGSFAPYWSGIHYALFMNHILPFKTGDVVRAGVIKGAKPLSWEQSVSSVVAMRVLDLGGLVLLAGIGTFIYMDTFFYVGMIALIAVVLLIIVLPFRAKHVLRKSVFQSMTHFASTLLSTKGLLLFGLILLSWVLEGFVIYSVGRIAIEGIGFFEAVWATSVAVVSGVFQVTPGNIAGYESVQSYALTFIDVPIETGYTIAIITHVFKFLYAYVTGVISFYLTPVSGTVIKRWLKRRG